jgi:hypothetical protein
MNEFEKRYEQYQRGEISQFDLIDWVQANMSGTDRNRALTRITISTAPQDIEDSGVTPVPGATMGSAIAMRAPTIAANTARAAGVTGLFAGAANLRARGGSQQPSQVDQILDVAFEGMPDVDTTAWRAVVEQALAMGEPPENIILNITTRIGNTPEDQQRRTSETLTPLFDSAAGQQAAPTTQGAGGRPPSSVDMLNDLVHEAFSAWESESDPDEKAFLREELAGLQSSLDDAIDLAAGRLTLSDGTVITTEMLNNPDPAVAAQYLQAFTTRQSEIENQNAALLNSYNLAEYDRGRERINDANTNALATYNASMSSIRERLARDEIDIERAGQEVDRAIYGLQESRSRAEFEQKTAMEAAPYGTVNGKTNFTGNDLGSGVATLQRQSGANPNTDVIRFPGSITLNPGEMLARGDQQFGVTGPLPTIPGLSITDADIPRGVSFQNPNSIQLPGLIKPRTAPTIVLPGQPGWSPVPPDGSTGPAYGPQVVR